MSALSLIRPDAGRAEVDLILTGMERRIYDVYRQAAVEMRRTAEEYLSFYEKAEAEKREQMNAGKITEAEYRQWCVSHMLTGKRYYEMSEVLAADLTNYDKIAASIINGHLPDVYACGFNYALYQAEIAGGFQTSFSLYDRSTVERLLRDEPDLLPIRPQVNVPKDMRWNKKQIAGSMMQSILQGESVPQIAQRMAQNCTGMSESTAVRNARTAVTAAENGGRNDRYRQLQAGGVDMEIEWSATLDNRTRMSHRELDGQRRAADQPFNVDGVEIEYPGDPKAPQHLIWNCRCTMLSWVKGFAPSEVVKTSPKLDVSYEEWKAGRDIQHSDAANRDAVNPDNPSYGYSGRNSARIKPEAYGYAPEMTSDPPPVQSKYQDAPIPQKKGLTSSADSGTMKNIEFPPETSQIRSMSKETRQLISDAFDRINAEYDVRVDEIITTALSSSESAVPFQFQPIRGADGELIKRIVINSGYDFMGSQEKFQARIMRNFNKGVLASNSIDGLIAHELAHIMTFQDVMSYTGYLLENKAVTKRFVSGISGYADGYQDGAECIAEAFAALRCGQPISDEAQKLVEDFIERWHKNGT